jgi:hypothetical protein
MGVRMSCGVNTMGVSVKSAPRFWVRTAISQRGVGCSLRAAEMMSPLPSRFSKRSLSYGSACDARAHKVETARRLWVGAHPLGQYSCVNGCADPTSQRMHDVCTPFNISIPGQPVWNISISAQPPFDLRNVAISPSLFRASATRAADARVCSLERDLRVDVRPVQHGHARAPSRQDGDVRGQARGAHGVQRDGGAREPRVRGPEERDQNCALEQQYPRSSGPAGQREYAVRDASSPAEHLTNVFDCSLNWRTAWSFFNESSPIAFVSERAHCE